MLNHASYGDVPIRILRRAAEVRAWIEQDPAARLGAAMLPELRRQRDALAAFLGIPAGGTAITANATDGAAAIMQSVELSPGDTVVVLSTEYSSIVRGWQVRAQLSGAAVVSVRAGIPFESAESLIEQLERSSFSVFQLSLVTSSTALVLPVAALAGWARVKGATVVLDAAHGPGHVGISPYVGLVDYTFGTVHKWVPAPRPAGFVFSARHHGRLRPAEVSVTWDSDDLLDRFTWPGTDDPAPRLCIGDALAQWHRWQQDGWLDEAEALACYATKEFGSLGLAATATGDHVPPRLRAFVVPVDAGRLRTALTAAHIRAPVMDLGDHRWPLLRIFPHVYNDEDDIARVRDVVAGLLRDTPWTG